jgi:hypothetical protein
MVARPFKLGVFGTETPVLEVLDIDCNRITIMRQMTIWGGNIKPDFAEFKPHISLSYNWKGTPKLAGLRIPDFDIEFDKYEVKDFDPGNRFSKVKKFISNIVKF